MIDFDVASISDELEAGVDGIWRARGISPVDYPESGHAECREMEDASFWFRHRGRCLAAVLQRFPPGGAVFDIGGGNGYMSLAIQQSGFASVLVEPGPQGIRNAQSRGVRPLVNATLENAGFRDRSLPAVGLFDVLEHLPDDDVVLARLARLLVPGGRLYLTVPAFRVLWSNEDVHSGHHRRYTRAGLAAQLRRAGFTVEYATYLFSWLPLPILLFRALPGLLGLRRGRKFDRNRREHAPRGSAVLTWLLDTELTAIARGRAVPLGSSALLVARAAA